MDKYNKKTVSDDLNKYDCFAKKGDFIEVSEWNNGEGYDIYINNRPIQLTYGELRAINYLVMTLDLYETNNKKDCEKDYEENTDDC